MKNAAASNWTIDVTDDDFAQEVIERSRQTPVVVDFWAPWCGPCKALGPILEALAREMNGKFALAKVNIDDNQQLAAEFQVESIPFVVAFRGGQPIEAFRGLLPEAQLREFINQIMPSALDEEVKQAASLERPRPAEAAAVYERILKNDPQHEAARLGTARLLITAGKLDEAGQILATIVGGTDAGFEADRLRNIIELRAIPAGDEDELRRKLSANPEDARLHLDLGRSLANQERFPEALHELLAAAELDKKLAGGEVRELMLKIFQIIGVRSELADEYRDKLRALLY